MSSLIRAQRASAVIIVLVFFFFFVQGQVHTESTSHPHPTQGNKLRRGELGEGEDRHGGGEEFQCELTGTLRRQMV